MQKIIPHLWYDKEAVEAANWYVSLFENSGIIDITTIPGTPSGDAELVHFKLADIQFYAISAGPYFVFNPTISFMISCSEKEEVDRLYSELSKGGTDLMPLDEYPFSKRYAWVQDRYGLSWQIMLDENRSEHYKIRPVLLFSGEACGKALEAIDHYVSVFNEATKGFINHYAPGEAMDQRAKINYSEIELAGMQMVAMDHGYGEDFTFNEAVSFMIMCENQAEIDYYWDKLSFVSEAEQCGWIKDQFGLSWQIVPANQNELLNKPDSVKKQKVIDVMLKMKKLDIEKLEQAYNE